MNEHVHAPTLSERADELEEKMMNDLAERIATKSVLFGMADGTGERVSAGPSDIQIQVRISAAGVSAERLRLLVEESNRCSPISAAARDAVPITLRVEVDAA